MAIGAIYKPTVANEPKPTTAETPKPVAEVTPQPANNGQVQDGANSAHDGTDDLISKVTQFEIEQNPINKSPEAVDAELFNDKEFRAEIDRVKSTNPELAKHMELLRKSAMTGVNNKFQQIAEMRKEIEAVKAAAQTSRFKANSVDELMNNPDFINEAKARLATQRSPLEDDSSLSDEAKQTINTLKAELDALKSGLTEKKSQEANERWNSQHNALAMKYKNYDSKKVDEVAQGLISGKIQATPEYIYKVVNHDDNVRRAYELGRREGSKVLGEKRQLNNSIDGVNAVALDNVVQEKEESNLNFMQKIISKRMAGAK